MDVDVEHNDGMKGGVCASELQELLASADGCHLALGVSTALIQRAPRTETESDKLARSADLVAEARAQAHSAHQSVL